jgi:hypothetical protein
MDKNNVAAVNGTGGGRRRHPAMWPCCRRVGQTGEERKKMTSSSNQNGMLDGLAGLPKWAGSVGCGQVLPLSIYFLFDSFSFFHLFSFY